MKHTIAVAVFLSQISLLGFASGRPRGGYEKAKWGMTLAQVKALYPGGVESLREGGSTGPGGSRPQSMYRLLRRVSGDYAVLGFFFESNGLKSVVMTFPARGSPVQLRGKLEYEKPSLDQAREIYAHLHDALTTKYGPPEVEWVNPDGGLTDIRQGQKPSRTTTWMIDAQSCAQLLEGLIANMTEADDPRGVVMIRYSDCIAEGTEGL